MSEKAQEPPRLSVKRVRGYAAALGIAESHEVFPFLDIIIAAAFLDVSDSRETLWPESLRSDRRPW
jgi:hypothetical protein